MTITDLTYICFDIKLNVSSENEVWIGNFPFTRLPIFNQGHSRVTLYRLNLLKNTEPLYALHFPEIFQDARGISLKFSSHFPYHFPLPKVWPKIPHTRSSRGSGNRWWSRKWRCFYPFQGRREHHQQFLFLKNKSWKNVLKHQKPHVLVSLLKKKKLSIVSRSHFSRASYRNGIAFFASRKML